MSNFDLKKYLAEGKLHEAVDPTEAEAEAQKLMDVLGVMVEPDPNNFHLYSSKLIGPKIRKLLKKNDYRLVDTFMEYNNLNGKKLKQALHTCSRLNIDLYKKTKKLFGDDWINQDEDFISNTLNCEYGIGDRSIPNEFIDLVSKDELRKVFHTFKKVFFENLMDS